eukprot:jgi/Mesen1/2755/ME000017S02124
MVWPAKRPRTNKLKCVVSAPGPAAEGQQAFEAVWQRLGVEPKLAPVALKAWLADDEGGQVHRGLVAQQHVPLGSVLLAVPMDNTVMRWSEGEVRELQAEYAVDAAHATAAHLRDTVQAVAHAWPGGSNSWDAEWAALVPVADLLNHSTNAAAAAPGKMMSSTYKWRSHAALQLHAAPWHVTPTGVFEVRAGSALGPQQEATISYGAHSTLDFLLLYGFVPRVNPSNKTHLYACVQDLMDDVHKPIRVQRRRKEDLLYCLLPAEAPLWVHSGGLAAKAYECALLLHATTDAELTHLESTLRAGSSAHEVNLNVSRHCVQAAAFQLAQRARQLLSQFPTSIQEDELLEKQALLLPREMRQLLVTRQRLASKLILQQAFQHYSRLAAPSP